MCWAASTMAAAGSFVTARCAARPLEAQKITPELIEAAKKEGKVTWYTSVDLPLAEKVAKAFEAKYPGVAMKVERSGAEAQLPSASGPGVCQQGLCLRCGEQFRRRPPDHLEARRFSCPLCARGCGARLFPGATAQGSRRHVCPRGASCSARVGYNTKLVKAEDRAEILTPTCSTPNGNAKIVKAHPGYSGMIMTANPSSSAETSVGHGSRSSPSRRSCRCSRRPIRRRDWPWASAP